METLERLANAILAERDLDARQFTQDLWREYPVFSVIKKPTSQNIQVVTLCAALVELFAQRRKQSPPEWAAEIGGIAEPTYVMPSFAKNRYWRIVCQAETPNSFRMRNWLAPADFLAFA